MKIIKNNQYPCNTSVTMKYIGGKWKAVILMHLTKEKRYNELRKEIPSITERTLSLQLKELETDGLIVRTVHTNKAPLKVSYHLTDFGKSLEPVLKVIEQWGAMAVNRTLCL
ncbi:helix-turn-helix domain-containing protein [Apibacter raozihei]|uniref:winged helix-turn-helix transcriptional regulator n=1 Tax=Apibacter raozihei TaxID=2500547 RepID=UPI000FE42148|nr:helix-turn-helix domain-containing protein [Apibacter raozihei]